MAPGLTPLHTLDYLDVRSFTDSQQHYLGILYVLDRHHNYC